MKTSTLVFISVSDKIKKLEMLHKYIPVQYNRLYYVYDCMDGSLYPCDKNVYFAFRKYTFSELLEKYKNNNPEGSISNFIQMLLKANSFYHCELSQYPKVDENMVLDSLARVPNIILAVTKECNLACRYCCYGSLYVQNTTAAEWKADMDVREYLEVLLKLRIKNGNRADFQISFYGGEPLLAFSKIQQCVTLADQLMPDVHITYVITTNGILLDKYMSYLVEHHFHILISLDGNEKNNQYRVFKNGIESFNIVVKNINLLYASYPVFFQKNVNFSTVLHGKSNCLDALIFFSKWSKTPLFSNVVETDVRKNVKYYQEIFKMHEYSTDEIIKMKTNYPNVYTSLFPMKSGQCYLWSKRSIEKVDGLLRRQWNGYVTNSCFLFSSKVFVSVDGSIFLCEKSSWKFKFGFISKEGVHLYLNKINGYYKKIFDKHKAQCADCYKIKGCNCCYFAESESVEGGKCFVSHNRAIDELEEMLNNKI